MRKPNMISKLIDLTCFACLINIGHTLPVSQDRGSNQVSWTKGNVLDFE